jgi:hypothetical protein
MSASETTSYKVVSISIRIELSANAIDSHGYPHWPQPAPFRGGQKLRRPSLLTGL